MKDYSKKAWEERLPFIQHFVEGGEVSYRGIKITTPSFSEDISLYEILKDTPEETNNVKPEEPVDESATYLEAIQAHDKLVNLLLSTLPESAKMVDVFEDNNGFITIIFDDLETLDGIKFEETEKGIKKYTAKAVTNFRGEDLRAGLELVTLEDDDTIELSIIKKVESGIVTCDLGEETNIIIPIVTLMTNIIEVCREECQVLKLRPTL